MPKIRNILIFIAIAVALILGYVFFVKPGFSDQSTLVSSSNTATSGGTEASPSASNPLATEDFLTLLLGVKNIKLNDTIFSDPAFSSLHDSSIVLSLDPTEEGRPNPFAPLGSNNVSSPAPIIPNTASSTTSVSTPPLKTSGATKTPIKKQ